MVMQNFRSMFSRMMQVGNRQRDLWKQFGYPEVIHLEDHWRAYKRGGVAARIVRSYPSACWRDSPIVRDDQGAGFEAGREGYSSFADAWQRFERVNRVTDYLHRADRLSRVGNFSLLVLGFADGKPLSEPMEGRAPVSYFCAYPERRVTVTQWDLDTSSPRYGKPLVYQITPATADEQRASRIETPIRSFLVHHTRVLHVVENPDENDVFGEPCLQSVWNYLVDLEKLVGGSMETFWLNARAGMVIEAASDANFSPEEVERMREQAEEYENKLRRILALQGAEVKQLTSVTASPQYHAQLLQALIAGTTGIPQRILFGSERGELASSQDENSWESRVDERRQSHCGPHLLEPFVSRMIETGNLPQPVGDWWIDWPEASAASPEKEAEVAERRMRALATYANSMSDQYVAPEEVRLMIGLTAQSEYELMERGAGLPGEGFDGDPFQEEDPESKGQE